MGIEGEKSRFDNSEYIDYGTTHAHNTWGRGIKSVEERQQAYADYCAHISKGRFKYSWRYSNPDTGSHWTYETIERWLRETDEFEPSQMKLAEASGFEYYENILLDSASGKNTKANVATLQMLMRNKFGWDRAERREINAPEILASYERVMLLLVDKQAQVTEAKAPAPITITVDNKA